MGHRHRRVLVCIAWPEAARPRILFASDGVKADACLFGVTCPAGLDPVARDALERAFAWGADPSRPLPSGWVVDTVVGSSIASAMLSESLH